MAPWGFRHLNHWGKQDQIYLGDSTFALMPWMVKPFSRRRPTKEDANYRISRGRMVVENAFGILLSRFWVLMGTMEQSPKVVNDVVFTCVVLLRTHQGEADRATPHLVIYWPYKMNK